MQRAVGDRSSRRRRAILDAATELFLREGYRGTSVDQIAALAAVSKQTVYKHFASKEGLLVAMLDETAGRAGEFIDTAIPALRDTDDLPGDLRRLARRYLATVMQPAVLRLRRLVIGAAGRLPELARDYHRRVPERTLLALAACFQVLAERGLLRAEDPRLAAAHFAFLVLGMPLDRAMFLGLEHGLDAAALDELADVGTLVFLRAYGTA